MSEWMRRGAPGRYRLKRDVELETLPKEAYAYLLGMYLGDGYIVRVGRTYRLQVSLDSRYPELIAEVCAAVAAVFPANKVTARKHPVHNNVNVFAHSSTMPAVFPQHGPGPKHRRPIVLADWQQEIVDEHTELFVRGLIHSDGCRVMNKVWGGKYQYLRYFFTQESVDIMDLFTDACDRLGIQWAFTKRNTVSVARRGSVALLDSFVGPKR